jgi:NADH:ubiquinone oxidoreductase subunit 6 (subunit J)
MQRNPVFAVFSFILTALLVFTLLLLMGAEFFALLILIIYTGVITVLFLFVVIIYNLRDIQLYIHNILFSPFFILAYAKAYWLHNVFQKGYIDVLKMALFERKRLNT